MTWIYRQSDGELLHGAQFQGTGYSGTGSGRNNPAAEAEEGVGPIPRAQYFISVSYDHPRLGPCVMNLMPKPGCNVHGRSLFRIHGDNARHDASHGCIILGPTIRHLIANSGDHDLTVIE